MAVATTHVVAMKRTGSLQASYQLRVHVGSGLSGETCFAMFVVGVVVEAATGRIWVQSPLLKIRVAVATDGSQGFLRFLWR